MDFYSVIAVITGLIVEHWRIILIVASGLLGLSGVVSIFGSMLKKERVQEKLYQGQIDQMDKTLNQILRELQEIRYAIYDLRIKDERFTQEGEDQEYGASEVSEGFFSDTLPVRDVKKETQLHEKGRT